MYDVLIGKQRGLVFPIMCNGGVIIDYSDNIPTAGLAADDIIGYGLWALESSFTLEAIITPYDINGYGKWSAATQPTIANSMKIMPSNHHQTSPARTDYQSEIYLPVTARLNHEMTIFSNYDASNNPIFWFGLVNTTLHNENLPATYKLRTSLSLNGIVQHFDSPVCISPSDLKRFKYDTASNNLSGFNRDGMTGYELIGSITSQHSSTQYDNSANNYTITKLFNGNVLELYYRDGFDFIGLGKIYSHSTSRITTNHAFSGSLSSGTELFIRAYVEPSYINDSFHVACVYDNVSKAVTMYLNGNKLSNAKHAQSANFTFAETDCKIGQCNSEKGVTSATYNKQFMGEIHELSIMDINRKEFIGLYNLLPNYENTLLYLRFEEADL